MANARPTIKGFAGGAVRWLILIGRTALSAIRKQLEKVRLAMLWTMSVLKELRELVRLARLILKALRLREPGQVFLKVLGKDGVGMALKFKLVLPPAGAPDVVSRKLQISIGGLDPFALEVPGSTLETPEYEGEDSAEVVGQLVDVDDAGNSSPPRDFSFVLTDTIAPPQPGELGLLVTAEA